MLGPHVTLTNPSIYDVTFTYSTAAGSAHENNYRTVTNAVATIAAAVHEEGAVVQPGR